MCVNQTPGFFRWCGNNIVKKKGNKVMIVRFKHKTREYEKDGQKSTITELIVEELELLTPKGQSDGGSPTQKCSATAS